MCLTFGNSDAKFPYIRSLISQFQKKKVDQLRCDSQLNSDSLRLHKPFKFPM